MGWNKAEYKARRDAWRRAQLEGRAARRAGEWAAHAERMKAHRATHRRWHRARVAVRHSLRVRLVLLFMAMALCVTVALMGGMQKAFGVGWRDAARPLLADYVDRLAADVGSPPSAERAEALTKRLPISVRIRGPVVNWQSPNVAESWGREHVPGDLQGEAPLLERTTADGHRIEFGLSVSIWQNRPRGVVWATLGVILLVLLLAFAYVRRLTKPLDDIRAGARRFGAGDFDRPIPVRRHDELGALAGDINTMASDIHQMLEAKRALLLAISHELRSPLTRARLNTELLPETEAVGAQREALLRDLAEMRDLVTELLETERLGQGHAALHLEATDLAQLARDVVQALPGHERVTLRLADDLPALGLDRTRVRLLLRNLLDNALRHSAQAEAGPSLTVERTKKGIVLEVRDFGPGVDPAALPRLAEPFYRPDESRERATGGVGLGLYLCKLIAQAHGARWSVENATPGLRVQVRFAGEADDEED